MRTRPLSLALAGSLLAAVALAGGPAATFAADASPSPTPAPTLSPAQQTTAGALISYFKAKNTIALAKERRAATTSAAKRAAYSRTITRASRAANSARAKLGTIPTIVTTTITEPCTATFTAKGAPLRFSIATTGAAGSRLVVTLSTPAGRITPGTRIVSDAQRVSVSTGAAVAGTYIARAYTLTNPVVLVAECRATVPASTASPSPSPSSSPAAPAAIAAPVFAKLPTNGERGGIFTWAAVDGAASYQCAFTLGSGTLSYGDCSGDRSYTVSASIGATIKVGVRGVTAAGIAGPEATYTWTVSSDATF